ncbi:uncharacterized protein BJ973_007784 [Actinoplanes tereljensis]|uniref:HEXXH motif-containing protein n=1 Tax=Paractinoplanes tereljensis TaxID=571912 RepID=A0A919TVT2_9ACTN|nr:HEXXH motif-containing putative peptide modification protein [Actinoplanes tereljensis]GIF24306.1 hypothetical protein Ate02nite_70360 [Actinoplanes tereljensis]
MNVRPHGLTRAQFADIAAGGGDAQALTGLAEAQVSKRLLLLREVRRVTGLGDEPAWALLDAVMDDNPPAGVLANLGGPFTDLWATRLLRRPGGKPTPVERRYLAGLAAAVAVVAQKPFELWLDSADGGVFLPGLGRFDGGAWANGKVLISYDGETLGTDGPQARWTPCRSAAEGVLIDDLDPNRDCFGKPVTDRLPEAEAAALADLCRSALRLIDEDYSGYAPTVRACFRVLIPLVEPAAGSVSVSHQNAFGAIATSGPTDAAQLALTLLHESAHLKLYALLDLVDLVQPGCDELFHAPWRSDPRPPGALLQGAYAHAAVAGFWRVRRHRITGPAARAAEFEYALWRDHARRAVETLSRPGVLTELGVDFVANLAGCLDGWPDDIRPDIRAGVTASATVTDVEWRLRNHELTDSGARELAGAYAENRPCPPLPAPRVTAGLIGAAAMANEQARALRQAAIAAETAEEPPTVADLDERLLADPGDASAWALLALALTGAAAQTVRERPELVRTLAATGIRPSAAAAWLSPRFAAAEDSV